MEEHHLNSRLSAAGPKRILALDGGGIRGALTLGYLEKIESILRERHNNPNLLLCDYFDLIGGTSTGAIIAAGLAIGKSASEIKALYLSLGEQIFGTKYNFIKGFLKGAKYDHRPLEKELDEIFKDITLGDERLKTGLCVITKRADTFSLWPVHNNPKGQWYNYNKHILLKDLLRATSAAPSYFQPKLINAHPPDEPAEFAAFIDGGVSPANNPSLQLFMMSQLKGYELNWQLGEDNLLLISIGTGASQIRKDYKEYLPKNLIKWAKEIPDLLMDDANFLNQSILQFLTKSPTARYIDSEIGDLSNDLLYDKALFTYQRYNKILDEAHLQKLNLSFPVSPTLVASLHQMDKSKNRHLLAEIGEKSAAAVQPKHFPKSFDLNRKREPITRFKKFEKPELPFEKALKKPIPIQCYQMSEPFEVETLEGTLSGKAGDYLMVGVDGELYPCDEAIFEKTYEKIEES